MDNFHICLHVTPQMLQNRSKAWMTNECKWTWGMRKPQSHWVYLHISVRAGLSTGQRSALGHGDAAFTHLTAKVISLVSHWALQGTVFSQVRAGVIWKSLGRGHLIVGTTIHQRQSQRGCLQEHSYDREPSHGHKWAIIIMNMHLLLSKPTGYQISLTSAWANM